jgi:hypothetical protein
MNKLYESTNTFRVIKYRWLKLNYLWMHPTPGIKTISAKIWHGGRRMHLIRAWDRQPLKVPAMLATHIRRPHYFWQHASTRKY